MRMYTRTGDAGETSLYGGKRTKKTNQRVVAYGAVDELNSLLGVVRSEVVDTKLKDILRAEQVRLFRLGADLATPEGTATPKPVERIVEADIKEVEVIIDSFKLEPIKRFIIPGASKPSAYLHLARAVCRRAEREVWKLLEGEHANSQGAVYLNRLSSLLFTLAVFTNEKEGIMEDYW